MRARNAVLQALHAFKALDPRISVNEVIAFLYAAENEGLTVQDMAQVARFTQSTASRSLRALGHPDRSDRRRRRWVLSRPSSIRTMAAATWSTSPPPASSCANSWTRSSPRR